MNGTHYARTSEAWLQQMDANKEEIMPILEQIYGEVCYTWLLIIPFGGGRGAGGEGRREEGQGKSREEQLRLFLRGAAVRDSSMGLCACGDVPAHAW